MEIRRCASSPFDKEFSLCGDSMESYEEEGSSALEDFNFARPGESITCEKCCHAIKTIKVLGNALEPRKAYLS